MLVKDTGASLETVKDNFSAAIAAEAARIKSAVALVDGSVVQNSNHPDTLAFHCIGSFIKALHFRMVKYNSHMLYWCHSICMVFVFSKLQ